MHPTKLVLTLELKGIQDSLLFIYNVFAIGIFVVHLAHDGDRFVHFSSCHEPPGCLGQTEQDDTNDDCGRDLDRDGEAPGDLAADEVHAEGEEVGDGDAEGGEQDFGGDETSATVALAKLGLATVDVSYPAGQFGARGYRRRVSLLDGNS